ncbi:glucose 1-dehydrogenase [candidate division TA06 bacterium]|uniref:Glucose 1-dehydrogenase n=1 Tax=candidate division TA06 bacterium TaxID=2250710 RepID=A0A523UMI1_UNCT6|nr:MAG: glucose 1-dehydrogenase [candidate division TA06 bacterium]
MKDLKGKSAIVTGGSLGIGTAIALDLAANGVNIAINYRKHADEANAVVEKAKGMGVKALAVKADVSNFQDAQNMVDTVVKEFGSLDILINNAGVNWDGVIWKMSEEQWDTVIGIDLKGCFNYIRAVSPIFREQKHGKIVNITSINALRGKFGQSNYSAAKAGVIGLTKTAAKELGKYSINVNSVAPGLIETEMIKKMPDDAKQVSINETTFKRLGTPEDVAHVVAFLCSDLSRHVTGEVIKVDGGQYI